MSNQKQIAKPGKAKDKREKQKKSSSSRKDKAIALVKNVEKNLDGSSFTVRSSSFQTSGRVYTVRSFGTLGKLLTCTCPDFEHRQSINVNNDDGGLCKHIIAVKLYIGQNEDGGLYVSRNSSDLL
jgi:SWIM zinc finger